MAIMQALMVPLMMATLAVVVGSQITGVGRELGSLLAVVPLYAAFLLVMVPLADAGGQRGTPRCRRHACRGFQRRDPQFAGRAPTGPGLA